VSRRRKSSIVRAWLLLFCVAPIGALGNDVVDRLPFRLKVDLEVSGQPVTIDRVVECRGVMGEHPGPAEEQAGKPMFSTMKRRLYWEHYPRNVHHVLPSGQLLVVYTPALCDLWSKRLKPLPKDYIPTISWYDSAEDIQVEETYVSPRYFEHPKARVRFNGISVEPANVPAEEWRAGTRWRFSAWEEATRMLARIDAQSYPESAWRRLPGTADRFAALREVTDVTSDELLRALTLMKFGEFYDSCGRYRGAGINDRVPETTEICVPIRADISHPLVRDERNRNRFRFADQPVGVRRYERQGEDFPRGELPPFAKTSRGHVFIDYHLDDFEIEYRGRVFPIRWKGVLLFDPARQLLIRIDASFQLFRKEN
jgi:hypothetical protein